MSTAPTRIGKYTILRELGRGSFAMVYLALGPDGSRPVALKLLHKSAKDKEILARFDRESELGVRLQHPGIVPVLDRGQDTRGPYIVLEYQEGGSLEDRLARGELSNEESAEVVVAVARAVHAAHEGGVIHRDLKPANILFDGLGNPRVTDFGLAHDAEALETMTRTGDVLGTPFYMAPEQISGSGVLDAQTDIYSLGVILYECLTGRRPYTTRRLDELVRLVVAGSPAPLGPGIAPPVRGVCRQAMSPDRSERFQTAEDMADALELAILPPAPPPNRVLRALVLLLLGGLAIGGVYLVGSSRAGDAPATSSEDSPRTPGVAPSWTRLLALANSDHPLEVIEEQLSAAVEADPESAKRIRRLLALTLWRRGSLKAAEEAAEAGSNLQRYLRAQRYEVEGDLVGAKVLYRDLHIGESPVARLSAVAYNRLSDSWQSAEQAATWLDAGEDGMFRSLVAVERATLAMLKADFSAARLRLEASLELEPRDVMVLSKLSFCSSAVGDRLGAMELLGKALDLCAPRAPTFLLVARARVALRLGDEARAAEDVARAEGDDPRNWKLLFLRGRLSALGQNQHKASESFRRSAELCPDSGLFVMWANNLPEETGVLALQSAGLKDEIPGLRGEASLRRRMKAVGGTAVYIALQAARNGDSAQLVGKFFEAARKDATDQAALAWEEALFWVGRDEFAEADLAIERARELGFDSDRLRLLEGKCASRKSQQDKLYEALEAVGADGRGVARAIAFSELAGYNKDWEASQRHAERARQEAPDDPLVWEAYLQAIGTSEATAGSKETAIMEARLTEALSRFGASWAQFLELRAQLHFFEVLRGNESREGFRAATQALKQDVEMIASISGGVRALLMGVDMILLRPSRSRRELAETWLIEAERRALPHQKHEILLTRGYVELTRPDDQLDVRRVLAFWRRAQEVEPKSKLKGNWYQIFEQRLGVKALEEFGEEFLPDPEDREQLEPPPKKNGPR